MKKKYAYVIPILLLILVTMSCKPEKSEPIKGTELAITELKHFSVAPKVKIIGINEFNDTKPLDRDTLIQELGTQLSSLLAMIVAKDLGDLATRVNRVDGLWVDLKAHHSYSQVLTELKDPGSYLNVFFLDTQNLQKRTGDLDKVSVRDVILISSVIEAEIFPEGDSEFELKLKLVDAPDYSFYLNNPVFRKKKGHWYIFRMP